MSNKLATIHNGPHQATPYPQSRLSPPISPHSLLSTNLPVSNLKIGLEGKLKIISDQIKSLQKLGEELIMETQTNIELHNIPCSIAKKSGDIFHLYRREDGTQFLSIISPPEWNGMFTLTYEGTFKLEQDMSWIRVDSK